MRPTFTLASLLTLALLPVLAGTARGEDSRAPVAASPTASSSAPAPVVETATAPAQPGPAPTLAPTPEIAITVTLKDGQTAMLTLRHYDRFFLSVSNATGTSFDIPWSEVASVDGSGADADLALMRGNITLENTRVRSLVEPRDPATALEKALWPGFLLLGSGLRYDGYNDSFVNIAGAELFGVVVGIFGAYLQVYPDSSDTSRVVPQSLCTAGIAIFAATWAWDLAFARHGAHAMNAGRRLSLEPLPQGAQLTYRF